MGEENNNFKWAVGTLIAFLAVCVSAAAVYLNLPKSENPKQPETPNTNSRSSNRETVPPPPSMNKPGVVVPAPTAMNGSRR